MITFSPSGNGTTSGVLHQTSPNGRSVGEIVVISFIVGVVQLLALFGNALVIACVYTYRRLKSEVGSVFIVNLAVTDMMSSIIVISSSFYAVINDEWSLGDEWCDIVCCMNYTLIISSMLTLCFISMDRYLAVVYALRYQILMSKRIAGAFITWAWFQGFCFGLAPVFMGWIEYDYWEIVCAIQWHVDSDHTLIYVIIAFILCFFIPGVVLCVFYCKVMAVAQRHTQREKSLAPSGVKVPYRHCNNNNNSNSKLGNEIANPAIDIEHIDDDDISAGKISRVSDTSMRKIHIDVKPVVDVGLHDNGCDRIKDISEKTPASSPTTGNEQTNGNIPDTFPTKAHDLSNFSQQCLGHQNNNDVEDVAEGDCNDLKSSKRQTDGNPQIIVQDELADQSSNPSQFSSFSSPFAFHKSSSPSSSIILQPESLPLQSRSPNKRGKISDTYQASTVDFEEADQKQNLALPKMNSKQNRSGSIISSISSSGKNSKKIDYSASSKALRSLLIVVLAYFICMTPFSATKLYKVIFPSETAVPGYVNVVASIFQYCSSAINPLIYGIFRKDFQLAFRLLLRKLNLTSKSTDNCATLSSS